MILLGATAAILMLEPVLDSARAKVAIFAGYIAGAAIFTLPAVDYGRANALGGWYTAVCAGMVGLAIIYMLVSVAASRHRDGGAPPPEPTTREHSNYVPAHPTPVRRMRRTFRSTARKLLANTPREYRRREVSGK